MPWENHASPCLAGLTGVIPRPQPRPDVKLKVHENDSNEE